MMFLLKVIHINRVWPWLHSFKTQNMKYPQRDIAYEIKDELLLPSPEKFHDSSLSQGII